MQMMVENIKSIVIGQQRKLNDSNTIKYISKTFPLIIVFIKFRGKD